MSQRRADPGPHGDFGPDGVILVDHLDHLAEYAEYTVVREGDHYRRVPVPPKPKDLDQVAEPPTDLLHVPSFDELRARITAHEALAARLKHESWELMRKTREAARLAEAEIMRRLRNDLEPLNAEVEAMKSVIIEHHASQVQPLFFPSGEPALMVF